MDGLLCGWFTQQLLVCLEQHSDCVFVLVLWSCVLTLGEPILDFSKAQGRARHLKIIPWVLKHWKQSSERLLWLLFPYPSVPHWVRHPLSPSYTTTGVWVKCPRFCWWGQLLAIRLRSLSGSTCSEIQWFSCYLHPSTRALVSSPKSASTGWFFLSFIP